MKRILILASLFLFASSGIAKGQAALLVLIFGDKVASENFYFSLKVGVNYSMINGIEEGSNRWGGNFGLVNNIRLSDRFFLTPEFVALSPRGVKDVPNLTTGNPELDELLRDPSSTDRKLTYIDIPVLLRMKLGKRVSVSAGPQFSVLTGATDVYRSSPLNDVVLTTEVDIKDAIARMDVGATLDVSFMVSKAKGGKGMSLFVRYTQGFIDMTIQEGTDRQTSSLFQFGAAFPFIEETVEEN